MARMIDSEFALLNAFNNYWSGLNNINSKNSKEAKCSFFLETLLGEFIYDVAQFAVEHWEVLAKPVFDLMVEYIPNGMNPLVGKTIVLLGDGSSNVIDASKEKDLFTKYAQFHISALDGNDNIIGDNRRDYLNGGKGDDILIGGAGADILVDEKGNDTYYILDRDIIFDADGLGKVIFTDSEDNSKTVEIKGFELVQSYEPFSVWHSLEKDSDGKPLMIAHRTGSEADLLIQQVNTSNTVVIQDLRYSQHPINPAN